MPLKPLFFPKSSPLNTENQVYRNSSNAFLNLISQEPVGRIEEFSREGVNESRNEMPHQEVEQQDTLKIYFEVEILNGGFCDDIYIGVSSKPSQGQNVGTYRNSVGLKS